MLFLSGLTFALFSLSPQRQRSQSFRRQSAPSLSISRALTRSKTLSRCSTSTHSFSRKTVPFQNGP